MRRWCNRRPRVSGANESRISKLSRSLKPPPQETFVNKITAIIALHDCSFSLADERRRLRRMHICCLSPTPTPTLDSTLNYFISIMSIALHSLFTVALLATTVRSSIKQFSLESSMTL
jgi:hypothetical protein